MELETLSNGYDIENIIIISNIPMQYAVIGRYFDKFSSFISNYIDYKIM